MKPPKFSESEVSQEIDLDELFPGIDLSKARAFKERLGQRIIDYMVDRVKNQGGMKWTSDGRGVSFDLSGVPYSKDYKESPEYVAFRKTGRVNMTLTGDMLNAIDVLETRGSTIKIGIDSDVDAAKAFNHQTGDTVRARPFFGVNKREIKMLASDLLPEMRVAAEESGRKSKSGDAVIKQEKLLEILDSLDEG